MTQNMTTTCDAPGCGKDITQGDGRQWRLLLMSQVVGMKPNATPRRLDAGAVTQAQYFCDETCVAAWATKTAADKSAAEAARAEAQKAVPIGTAAAPAPAAAEPHA